MAARRDGIESATDRSNAAPVWLSVDIKVAASADAGTA